MKSKCSVLTDASGAPEGQAMDNFEDVLSDPRNIIRVIQGRVLRHIHIFTLNRTDIRERRHVLKESTTQYILHSLTRLLHTRCSHVRYRLNPCYTTLRRRTTSSHLSVCCLHGALMYAAGCRRPASLAARSWWGSGRLRPDNRLYQ
ncbi:hypothetical protein DPMN_105623 [Dreissena polymorpha]|uniref:Uncharacterized protein n=1 Tax=Dreissena polymorpha TaxID=45954 RepID=A0A9D4K3I9_DREPO|nr:hypothetical protein DPMN_161030 [Dreissena polymorpha]KAH3832338.1 hypothetical protein DPMN_105623 [Dreissena polymorpha]